jgi:hypothetical protein
MSSRFDRNIALFGTKGQARLRDQVVAVVGIGGLGTRIVQEVALLGVGAMILIDHEDFEESNRNRYVGVTSTDPPEGLRKVDIGARLARSIDAAIKCDVIDHRFPTDEAFRALRVASWVFGCLDNDGARLILNEFCSAYAKPYIDVATDVTPGQNVRYGGRVVVNVNGEGCLVCMGEIDENQAGTELAHPDEDADRQAIYGVDQAVLGGAGPSVAPLNGVVACLAAFQFMACAPGL